MKPDPPLLFREPQRRSFTMMPDAVLLSPRLSPGAKLVYEQLLHYARRSAACFPGQATLARHLPATERTVGTCLRQLAALGLITIERRGWQKTNRYWIETLNDALIQRLSGPPAEPHPRLTRVDRK
jgi:hypothetical protein